MTDHARREVAPLLDMLHEMGGKLLFQASSAPPTPKADPVLVQGWSVSGIPILLSIRSNSGNWTAFGAFGASNEAEEISLVRRYLSETLEKVRLAKAEKRSA